MKEKITAVYYLHCKTKINSGLEILMNAMLFFSKKKKLLSFAEDKKKRKFQEIHLPHKKQFNRMTCIEMKDRTVCSHQPMTH